MARRVTAVKDRIYRQIVRAYKARTPFFRRFPTRANIDAVDFRTLIHRDMRCVYSRIPKAANSTVVASLFVPAEQALERAVVERVKFGDIRPSDLSKGEVADICEGYFKFTVVRNPYTRLLSAHRDKIARPSATNARFRALLGVSDDREVPLDQFLEALAGRRFLMSDAHWMPQLDLMAFPVAAYDMIGSVETLDRDLAALQGRLGVSGALRDYVPHKTGSTDARGALTPQQAAAVRMIYAKDFEGLGYGEGLDVLGRA
ncbi:sulfotransferase family protein [Shimia sediminis]|uniref:sulfotransferase family protein n=1 Tax=Shimia sediminis TaxID=2497945 RepID=UPI000F8EBCB6|nr:sulfotransferase family protein [Shimia sediminis]